MAGIHRKTHLLCVEMNRNVWDQTQPSNLLTPGHDKEMFWVHYKLSSIDSVRGIMQITTESNKKKKKEMKWIKVTVKN